MARTGERLDPYRAFNFRVEVEGLVAGGFSKCSGLQAEIETKEVREGGVNGYVERLSGRVKHPPLVLERGLCDIDGLWRWYQDAARGRVKRRNGTIHLLDAFQTPVMHWDFKHAFPTKWTGPELRADANAVAFESIELVHRGLEWSKD